MSSPLADFRFGLANPDRLHVVIRRDPTPRTDARV